MAWYAIIMSDGFNHQYNDGVVLMLEYYGVNYMFIMHLITLTFQSGEKRNIYFTLGISHLRIAWVIPLLEPFKSQSFFGFQARALGWLCQYFHFVGFKAILLYPLESC